MIDTVEDARKARLPANDLTEIFPENVGLWPVTNYLIRKVLTLRTCGILYPVFSLPTRFGIGSISKEAYAFIDFLKAAGQGAWQMLPIGPTGYGDSPYQPFSAFAGNPYFVDLEDLISQGLLEWHEVENRNWGSDPERVDYSALYDNRYAVLRIAYDRFLERGGDKTEDYQAFVKKESDWLDDYCLFMVLKDMNEGKSWLDWETAYRKHDDSALQEVRADKQTELGFFAFVQFMFATQWAKLRAYAKKQNIAIIGDMPFYLSMDSADVWAHPEVFLMDKDDEPTLVAGCAPDAFSKTGQLWGNPLYDWAAQKKDKYKWWIERIQKNYEYFDVIRVDHFHGFSEYYAIPYGDETAENGKSMKGPGMDFFKAVRKAIPDFDMIAEDLGTVTKENTKLLKDSGLPGMKILEYAFTSWDSIYIPYRHEQHCVVYTGTHDNAPVREWLDEINDGERDFLRRYLNSMNTDYGALTWDFIREAYRSVADLCIIPIQDYLVKGKEARINTPGTFGCNWMWRVKPGFLSDELARSIRGLADVYGRIPKEPEKEK